MTKVKKIATAALVVLISGCGGGGGGGGGGGSTPGIDTSSLKIDGDVFKGAMANAKVSLYKTTAEGQQGDMLVSTMTDGNGSYSATVKDYSGVVIMEASVLPGTTMYDEATEKIIVPATGFVMRASFSAEAGKLNMAQINPLTDLTTVMALAKPGGLSAINVAQANKDLAESLTFDPLTSKPEFDTTTKAPKNAAAATLAAVSGMAESGALGCAAGEQAAKVACVTKALSDKGLADAGVKASLQTFTNAVTFKAGLPAVTFGSPSGTAPSTASTVEQTKAFLGTLRSNAKALDATDLSLQTELQAVSDDMTGRTIPIASTSLDALNVARLGVQFWNDVVKGNMPFVSGQSFHKDYKYLGGCSFYIDANYTVLATAKDEARYVACQGATQNIPATDTNGKYKGCFAVGDWCNTSWSYRVRLHPDAADVNKFTIYTHTREAKRTAKSFTYSYQSTTGGVYGQYVNNATSCPTGANCISYVNAFDEVRTNYGAAFPGNTATLVTQQGGNGKIIALTLTGELSPGYQIRGGSSYYDYNRKTWLSTPPVATLLGDMHKVALSAALTKVGDLDKLALSGSMELIKAGALETRMELIDGSYLQAKLDQGNYSSQNGSQEMLLKLKASTAGSAVLGDVKLSAFKLDASGTSYIPTLVSFAGSVQRKGVSFFEGTLTGEALNHASFKSTQPHSADNVQIMRVGFTGKVVIPTRPALNVNLSVVNNDTGNSTTNTATLGGQYSQGGIVINLVGKTSAASNILTLTSSEGVTLVIDKSKTSYPLTKSGVLVGNFLTSSNRINYTDSSYEQY